MTTAPLNISPEEIRDALAPFVVERLAPDDPRWLEALSKVQRKYARPPKKERRWTTGEGERTADLVKSGYEETWGRVSLQQQLNDSKVVPYEWGDECLMAAAIGRKRVHQLLLARVVESLHPSSVLEVGSGYGLNLLLLSMQFPRTSFSGVELTEAGVAATRTLANDPSTPSRLTEFTVRPLLDPSAPARLTLQQGSADALPVADRSVDMVITVLALEQMERIREGALRELARVSRRHVVMIEPFADWNADGHRLEYIRRHDYFAARVDELPRYGLTPLMATADLPNKLTFRAGLVVAAVQAEGTGP